MTKVNDYTMSIADCKLRSAPSFERLKESVAKQKLDGRQTLGSTYEIVEGRFCIRLVRYTEVNKKYTAKEYAERVL